MRHAIRTLLRDRAYTAIALLTLAFGIAVNTIIFSLVNGVLLRPLAWREPGQLVVIHEIVPELAGTVPVLPVNSRHFFEWRDRSTSFAALAIIDGRKFTLTRAGEPEQVAGARISANFFSMLGVQPQFGRGFLEEEDHPGHDRVAVISDALWNRKFHRDPGLVGRSITLDGAARTVVGILPASFHFPRLEGHFTNIPLKTDIFIPAAFERDAVEWLGDFNYTVIGRLNPGVALQRALAELDVIQASIATHFPEKVHLRAAIAPLQDQMVGPVRRGLLILFGAVGVVLLIVCVNLANLTLARVTGRRRDLAIRTALGAGRAQLVRYILTETICIALLGGAAGIALASQGLRAVLRYAPVDLPRLEDIHLDARVLLFATGISLLTGILMGLLPAWRAASADPQESLRGTSHTATEGRPGLHMRDLLVGLESALSAVLLIAAGLFIASFVRLLNVDQGFHADRLIAVEINLPSSSYAEPKQREPYFRALAAKLQAIPGVANAGLVSHLPLEGQDWGDFIQKDGDHRPTFQQTFSGLPFLQPRILPNHGHPAGGGSGVHGSRSQPKSGRDFRKRRSIGLARSESDRPEIPSRQPARAALPGGGRGARCTRRNGGSARADGLCALLVSQPDCHGSGAADGNRSARRSPGDPLGGVEHRSRHGHRRGADHAERRVRFGWAAEISDVADHRIRCLGAASGLYWHLRRGGVVGLAAQKRDRHSHGSGRALG